MYLPGTAPRAPKQHAQQKCDRDPRQPGTLFQHIFDDATHRVIGAGIVGPNAGDLIAEVALAIEMGCEAADIGLTVHPHPTLSESVGMAAEVYEGTITDLYIPRKK